jgi:hypothetical protein
MLIRFFVAPKQSQSEIIPIGSEWPNLLEQQFLSVDYS